MKRKMKEKWGLYRNWGLGGKTWIINVISDH